VSAVQSRPCPPFPLLSDRLFRTAVELSPRSSLSERRPRDHSECRCELAARFAELVLSHDRVAAVDVRRLVPGELHGDRARNASALEVPDSGATEVVEDEPRQARLPACRLPRPAERLDRPAVPVKDSRDDAPWARSQRRVISRLLDEAPQFRNQREVPSLVVLRGPGSDLTSPPRQIDLKVSGSTSQRLRQPIMKMNRTASASSGEVPADCVHMVDVREPLPGVVSGRSLIRGIVSIMSLSTPSRWAARRAASSRLINCQRSRMSSVRCCCGFLTAIVASREPYPYLRVEVVTVDCSPLVEREEVFCDLDEFCHCTLLSWLRRRASRAATLLASVIATITHRQPG
jgi:hypothetical protein